MRSLNLHLTHPGRTLVCLVAAGLLVSLAWGNQHATVSLADGFDLPVGRGGEKKYYKARGFRENGHLGEDWNGAGGGDTDLGDPVYATARGLVVFAEDYRLGWGNVVIVRHAYMEGGAVCFVDSLYGHLQAISVRNGQPVVRGQTVGTIGNNGGMYDAHLHFEIRKNLQIGMHRSSFARNFTNYWDPTAFIMARSALEGGGRLAVVPVNTFAPTPPPAMQDALEEGFRLGAPPSRAVVVTPPKPAPVAGAARAAVRPAATPGPRGPFKVDRFGDMRALGYE